MREIEDLNKVKKSLKEFSTKTLSTVLIIDGKSLDTVFKDESC